MDVAAEGAKPAAPQSYAYVVFEGGGAAGIIHVGALRALEDVGIQPLGVAGASAGAIVAALVAAGYAPDAIVARDDRPDWNIFRRNNEGPIFLIGNHDWLLLVALTMLPVLGILLVLLAISGFATVLLVMFVTGLTWLLSRLHFLNLRLPAPLRLLLRLAWFPSEGGRDFLERVLQQALDAANPRWRTRDQETPARFVRFIDLIDDRFLPLRVVATDIDSGRMRIFDATRTPFHSVADAVIASMSIPLVFPPARVRVDQPGAGSGRNPDPGPRFVDGGLLSNLPVAVLASQRRSSERQLGMRIPIIAFAIDKPDEHVPARRLSLFPFLARVLRTGIFGSQAESIGQVPGVTVVRLETAIGLTQFNLDRETAQRAIETARDRARQLLSWRLVERPQQAAQALEAMAMRVRSAFPAPAAAPRLRATLYQLTEDEDLVVVESWNRSADPDALLALDPASPVALAVNGSRSPQHVRVSGLGPAQLAMRADEHRLLPDWLNSQLGFPIFMSGRRESRLEGLLLLESDSDLSFVLGEGQEALLANLEADAQGAARFLADEPPDRAQGGADAGRG